MSTRALSILSCILLGAACLRAGEAPPPGGSEVDRVLDEEQDILDRENTAKLAAAQAAYVRAVKLFNESFFEDALRQVEEALRIYPAHREAQELAQRIKGILGYRDDRFAMIIAWLGDLGDVARQENAIRLHNLLKDGREALEAGRYLEAHNLFDTVAINIQTFPIPVDWGEVPAQVEDLKLQAQARARQADHERHKKALAEANRDAALLEQRRAGELHVRVNKILARAHRAYVRGLFKRAAYDALYAYKMDRRREDARKLYLAARRASHRAFDDWYMREVPERRARVNETIHASLIPQDELLAYPEHWDRIDRRQLADIGEKAQDEWRLELAKRLDQEVTFVWEDTPLEDAIQFLRQTTGVNFVIDPAAQATSPPPISLKATNMKLGTALKWIERITRLTANLRGQVVFISNEITQGDVVVRPYDVTDLTISIPDFEGPALTFATGGGNEGFDVFGAEPAAAADADPNVIADFIRANVMPTSWDAPGRGIEARRGGTLFVSTSPEIHDQVDDLLRQLRERRALQVNVRVRVLDLTKTFIEEIGFEWHDLLNATGLLGTTTVDGFTKIGSEALVYSRITQALPGAATEAQLPAGAGMGIELAYNPTGMFNTPQVNALLDMVEMENDATVLLAPELTCYNGQRSVYMFIRQYAYIRDYNLEGGGDGNSSSYDPEIEILNLGDVIDIRPLVSADRKYVTLEMRPVSRLLAGTFIENIRAISNVNQALVPVQYPLELPNVELRTLRTTVTLPDKGSMLMGGYTRGLRQRMHSGIPFLSHIPFLGRLFSKNGLYDENRRLFFLVTSTILDLGELEAMQ